MKFFSAYSAVTSSASIPRSFMSCSVSNARYGLIALAPYPISNAKCITSRGSPLSIINATWVRVLSRTSWLCTAAIASRLGIGAIVSFTPRSDRISNV